MTPSRHLRSAAGWAAGALLLASAGASSAQEALRVSGTGVALGAMRRLAAAFEKANPGLRLRLLPSAGSNGAMKALEQGALDIGLSSREPTPEERAQGLVAVAYARTPFVFAVGPRVGVTGLTAGEVVRIYRGETPTWPSGERVRLVLRQRGDSDTQFIRAISAEMAAAVDLALTRPGMLMAATNQECNQILSRTPGSIGPTSLTQVLTEDQPVTPLAWNGVAPTVPNLASGAYPLAHTLYLVVRTPAPSAVRRFIAFLRSPEARVILQRAGNLPLPLPALE